MTENHPQRQVQERFREYIKCERRNILFKLLVVYRKYEAETFTLIREV